MMEDLHAAFRTCRDLKGKSIAGERRLGLAVWLTGSGVSAAEAGTQ